MKRFFLFAALALLLCVPADAAGRVKGKTRADKISSIMQDPKSDYVIVIAHRGDWRHAPENSIPAIEGVIAMGADVVELDVQRTADGVLVMSHDGRVDRCTDGTGLIKEMTYEQLRKFHLKRDNGEVVDSLHILTLREALMCTKDRICVNLDKGYNYYDQILELTEELGVTDQVLIKSWIDTKTADAVMARHPHNMLYMPVINLWDSASRDNADGYLKGNVPIAFEVCMKTWDDGLFEAYSKWMLTMNSKVWVNTLWPSISGGPLTDDASAWNGKSNPDAVYGRPLKHGVSMIQTDNPAELVKYLEQKGRHTLK